MTLSGACRGPRGGRAGAVVGDRATNRDFLLSNGVASGYDASRDARSMDRAGCFRDRGACTAPREEIRLMSLNRRQMLFATGAALLGAPALNRALAADKASPRKVLFFTKSSGFQHSVVTRKDGKLG